MNILQIILLAVVQGAAELLPVSSSAHVIVTAKLMGLDPTSPQMTLLLVMLHTGTMFAVICYFWRSWRRHYFGNRQEMWDFIKLVVVATGCTGVLGLALKYVIEKVFLGHIAHAEVEMIFGNLDLVSGALACAGILIIFSGLRTQHRRGRHDIFLTDAAAIGLVQGLCLPFRGFSRSGATISTGLLLGVGKMRAEDFSFALAVVLTPPVIVREVLRLLKAQAAVVATGGASVMELFYPSLLGMVFSFLAGMLALRWLSRWLENGRWQYFGGYCLVAAGLVFWLHHLGY